MATGAIAIGTAATSTSTTIIILIRTTISIETSTEVRADKETGNTIHNTAGTLLTATEGLRTSSVARVPAEPGIAVVRAALAGPEDQVVPENQAVPAELVHGRGEAEVEPGRVQALGTDHPHGRLVVPQGTKSVTVAHHRDRAVVLAAGDLAAAAEITREPAAAEAAAAWEVAE